MRGQSACFRLTIRKDALKKAENKEFHITPSPTPSRTFWGREKELNPGLRLGASQRSLVLGKVSKLLPPTSAQMEPPPLP
jgi:hypothetical protein